MTAPTRLALALLAAALLSLTTAGCGGAQPPPERPAAEEGVSVRAVLLGSAGDLALGVEVAVRAPAGAALPEPLELVVPESWAGFTGLGEVMLDMVAEGPDGEPLRLHREPGLARVRHDGAGEIRVRYLVEPVAHELRDATRFQALVRPSYVFAYGRNLFVWPRHLAPSAPVADLTLELGPAGTRWATTLGAIAESWRGDGLSYYDLAEEAYLAGAFVSAVDDSGPDDATVGAVLDPELRLDFDPAAAGLPAELSLAAAFSRFLTVWGAIEGLWRGRESVPDTVAIVLRRAPDSGAATGSGRPGGIVLEVGDDADWRSFETAHLIAHELMHRVVGFTVRFAAGEEQATLWFKEGVLDLFAATCARWPWVVGYREGLLAAIGRAVTGYYTAQRTGAGAGAGAGDGDDYWHSAATRRAPYDRGFLIGLGLEALLRRHDSDLAATLAELVRARRDGPPLSRAALVEALVEASPASARAEVASFLEAYAVSELPLPVDDWLSALGLRAESEEIAAAYFGVDVEEGRDGRWRVLRVDPRGPARLSGLVPGERLLEAPVLPERAGDGRFVVQRGASRQTIVVTPSRGLRRVWVVREQDDAATVAWP